MKCIICGRTEADFEEMKNELIEKIDKVLEILYNKRKRFKVKISDKTDSKTGTKLGEINKEIKMLNRLKEALGDFSFFYADIPREILNILLPNNCNEIIEKYLPNKESKKNSYKICFRCKLQMLCIETYL